MGKKRIEGALERREAPERERERERERESYLVD